MELSLPQQSGFACKQSLITFQNPREPHILDRPVVIHLPSHANQLEVLCELLVDFDNLKLMGPI